MKCFKLVNYIYNEVRWSRLYNQSKPHKTSSLSSQKIKSSTTKWNQGPNIYSLVYCLFSDNQQWCNQFTLVSETTNNLIDSVKKCSSCDLIALVVSCIAARSSLRVSVCDYIRCTFLHSTLHYLKSVSTFAVQNKRR